MNANDFMFGDLVQYTNKQLKVALTPKGNMVFQLEFGLGMLPIWTDVSPIRLTENILSKNGFSITHWNGYDIWRFYKSLGSLPIEIMTKDNAYYIDILGRTVQIYFVHELQHALRLCRFNDLANNFVIPNE